jgi:hypothetical protein
VPMWDQDIRFLYALEGPVAAETYCSSPFAFGLGSYTSQTTVPPRRAATHLGAEAEIAFSIAA